MSELEKQREALERRAQVHESRLLRTVDELSHRKLVHGVITRLLRGSPRRPWLSGRSRSSSSARARR